MSALKMAAAEEKRLFAPI
jgi:hypothetical protein